MAALERRQLSRKQIEAHLKSAIADLTPNVLDSIDLSTRQMSAEEAQQEQTGKSSNVVFLRRVRAFTAAAAACLCLVIGAGGIYTYQNGKVDSVIGIDVNPSVELSVNRKNRVLAAIPLNDDAKVIMDDMDLKGTDLNVAVNAVIGSMVTHGFLDDLDNAILVTVTNDSISKATALRTNVVNDIQSTLMENQVEAVVYDQQVIQEDAVKELADQYQISYGKAYFLKELIEQNDSLSMTDMDELSALTMEEIAREITERSYAVGGLTKVTEETSATSAEAATVPKTQASTAQETTTTAPETTETEPETTAPVTEPQTTQPPQTTPPVMTTEAPTTQVQEDVAPEKVKIDYVDYENGVVIVNFKTKVKWKNPTVSVKDEEGNTYSAMVGDMDSSFCEILVSGLDGGKKYTFVLGGVSPKNGKQTTARGTFETPIIGDGQADDVTTEPEETEPPTTQEEQETPPPVITEKPLESETPPPTMESKTAEQPASVSQEG